MIVVTEKASPHKIDTMVDVEFPSGMRPEAGWTPAMRVPKWVSQFLEMNGLHVGVFEPIGWSSAAGVSRNEGERAQLQINDWRKAFDQSPVVRVGVIVPSKTETIYGVVSKTDLKHTSEELLNRIRDLRNKEAQRQDRWTQTQIQSAEMAYLLLTGTPYAGHSKT